LRAKIKNQLILLSVLVVLIVLLALAKRHPEAVETYYSRGFYPLYGHLPKLLLGWIPFSVGDVFYVAVLGFFLISIGRAVFLLFAGRYPEAVLRLLRLASAGMVLYLFFHLSWGLNYYRRPLHEQLGLRPADSIRKADYLRVLDRYIVRANALRGQLQPSELDRNRAEDELETLMRADTLLAGVLSKTQVRAKSPISSGLVSRFTVTGYFNPFTQEAHVNRQIPIVGYPFTVAHELAHQMGIGFEDECNFIAFLKLKDHPDPWYAYAAAYETVQYMLGPLRADEALYREYVDRISPAVKADYAAERDFWRAYSGWINTAADVFYSGYLKHNNQPEGMERYSMMGRLVVAWELAHPLADGEIFPTFTP